MADSPAAAPAAPARLGDEPLPQRDKREIGALAVWTVSSCKSGHGVDSLRDDSPDTYWQSDGAQPHIVNIAFQRKVELLELALCVDFKQDESYTPKTLAVRAGNSIQDMKELRTLELTEPVGWIHLSLPTGTAAAPPGGPAAGVRAYLVQLVVLTNHQNGRDTHVRQVKIYGPRKDMLQAAGHGGLTTVEFLQYAVIR